MSLCKKGWKMFEKEAKEYGKENCVIQNNGLCTFVDSERTSKIWKDGAEFGYNKANEWFYDEPTESKNNFYVILKNGNHRICYWDLISKADKCLKNVVNGEHITFNFIRCWKEIVLPKEME